LIEQQRADVRIGRLFAKKRKAGAVLLAKRRRRIVATPAGGACLGKGVHSNGQRYSWHHGLPWTSQRSKRFSLRFPRKVRASSDTSFVHTCRLQSTTAVVIARRPNALSLTTARHCTFRRI